jgi:hypothetical protein
MATDVGPARNAPSAKYDAFIAAQLERAEKRVRALDLTAALLGLVAVTAVFAVVMALLDNKVLLSSGARRTALIAYLVGAAVYLALTVLRPLRWRVNPYYAARQVEKTLPGAKNSVVNWVDLHEQNLPGLIRSAVGQRAAKDLARADLDRAISGRRTGYVGGLTAVCCVALILACVFVGPRSFMKLLGRTFIPFTEIRQTTNTTVTFIRPPDGDVTLPIGSPFHLVVQVSGGASDPRLRYHSEESEPYRERFLQYDEVTRQWTTTLSPPEVGNGFHYRVAAGDFQSDEYQVTVRAGPLITDFLATYHFRPYVARPDVVRTSRRVEALQGTVVDLLVSTNRTVKEGTLELEAVEGGVWPVRGNLVGGDPTSLRFNLRLERSGKYLIRYTSAEGEHYSDPERYDLVAVPDRPPQVVLTDPGKDVELPSNGVLNLAGRATDDVGVKSLTLRMQMSDGLALRKRPYRGKDKLRLADGGYPRAVDYRDFVDLAEVRSADGKPVRLRPGMVLEYWLEAADACDYPRPNVTQSKPRYRVKIVDATRDEQRQEKERSQAKKQQEEHEKNQDRRLKQENDAREKQRQQEEANKQEAEKKREENKEKSAAKDNKDTESKEKKTEKRDAEQKDKRNDPGDKGKDEGQSKKDEEKDKRTKEQAQKLKESMDKRERDKENREEEQAQRNKGEGKGETKEKPGKGKEAGERKSDGEGKDGQQHPGKDKGPGNQDPQDRPGQGKEQGSKDRSEKAKGEAKPEQGGQVDKGKGKSGPGKEGQPKAEKGNEPGKGKAKPERKAGRGEGKDGGSPEDRKAAAECKPSGQTTPQQRRERGQAKDAGSEGKPQDGQREGASKGRPDGDSGKGVGKPAPQDRADAGKGKSGGSRGAGRKKPDPKPDDKSGKPGESKDDGADKGSQQDATPDAAKRLAKDLKSSDQGRREQAARELEKIKNQARDPQAREEAKRQLEQGKREAKEGSNTGNPDADQEKPGRAKPGKPKRDPAKRGSQDERAGEGKESGQDKKADAGSAKGDSGRQRESRDGPNGKAKGGAADKQKLAEENKKHFEDLKRRLGDKDEKVRKGAQEELKKMAEELRKMQQRDGQRTGKEPGQPDGKAEQEAAKKRLGEMMRDLQSGDPKKRQDAKNELDKLRQRVADAEWRDHQRRQGLDDVGKGKRPGREKPLPSRAGMMQLDDFRKRVDKNVLDDAKMSPEEFQRFLKDYEDLLKRQTAAPKGKEVLPGVKHGGPLPSSGGRQIKGQGKGGDVQGGGRALPPPGYRDAYAEFLRRRAAGGK